jgi:hypothetical protein
MLEMQFLVERHSLLKMFMHIYREVCFLPLASRTTSPTFAFKAPLQLPLLSGYFLFISLTSETWTAPTHLSFIYMVPFGELISVIALNTVYMLMDPSFTSQAHTFSPTPD